MKNLLKQKEARVEKIVNTINDWFEEKRVFWAGFDRHPMPWINMIELGLKFFTIVYVMTIAQTYVRTITETWIIIGGFVVQETVKIGLWQRMMKLEDYSGSKKYIAIVLDVVTRALVLSIAITGSHQSTLLICTIIVAEAIRIPTFMMLREEKDIVRISQILTLIEVATAIYAVSTIM